jgi:hypothetical protein
MILPESIPHSLKCPFCQPSDGWEEQDAKLEWRLHPHPNGKKSEYLSYCCKNCNNAFTTTASDTISLRHYNSKKRSLLRKNKIKKL